MCWTLPTQNQRPHVFLFFRKDHINMGIRQHLFREFSKKSVSEVRIKSHKKGSKNILFFLYLGKLSRNWGKFSSSALVIDTFYVKYFSVLAQ